MEKNWNYLNKNLLPEFLCNPEGKQLTCLWLLTKSDKQNFETFNDSYLLRLYSDELAKFQSSEELLEYILKYIESLEFPSSLSKWINNIYLFNEYFYEITRKYEFPKYEISESPLCFENGMKPSLSIPSYLNFVSPQMTGYFIENVFAYLIRGHKYCLKSKFKSCIDYTYLTKISATSNPLTETDKEQLLIHLSNDGYYKTYIHWLTHISIGQFINKSLSCDKYNEIFKFIQAIDNEKQLILIDKYINELNETVYLKHLKELYTTYPENENFHSVNVAGTINGTKNNLHGECDYVFMKPYTIIDAKVANNPTLNTWFNQLMIYKKLMDNDKLPNPKLKIISFLNNTIYTFKY